MQNVTRVLTAISIGLLLAFSGSHATTPEEFLGAGQTPKTPPAVAPATAPKPAPAAKATPAAKAASAANAAPAAKPGNVPVTSAANATPAAKASGAKNVAAKPPVSLDTAKIHLVYLDGDFDQATKTLENHLKSKLPMSHSDSIFAFKHLGVMYAASAATREKGRYYMYQLINIEPTAKILDMYASDMIYLIFRNVQEDVEIRRVRIPKPAVAPETTVVAQPVAPDPASSAAPVAAASPARSSTTYWVTGGAVLAAGTAGLLYILLDDPKPKTHTILVKE